jgi:hypothetical protein
VSARSEAWANSGAMYLTGRADGPPLGAPGILVDVVGRAADTIRRHSDGRVDIDGLALLGERAALGGMHRQGSVSCGGHTRLLAAADGWVALCLARADDVDALSAWLCRDIPDGYPWREVAEAVASLPAADLDDRAALLGLPCAALGSVDPPSSPVFDLPLTAERMRPTSQQAKGIESTTVIDLSALWAGPLCAQLLAEAGADVIKVESTTRPDGARQDPRHFFDLLNGQKRSVALDLRTESGQRGLHRLIRHADVVIESSRPRALEQMGINAAEMLTEDGGPRIWVSITSHGRSLGSALRVGFGDVAAAAGGLIAHDEDGPCFLSDAVADPLTGLVGAAAALEALSAGDSWLINAAMAPMAAALAGPALNVGGHDARLPRARDAVRRAPRLGEDTDTRLRALGV